MLKSGFVLALWLALGVVAYARDGLSFTPPSGWQRIEGPSYAQTGIIGVWALPGDGNYAQNIVLRLMSESASLEYETDPDRIRRQYPDAQVEEQPMALCGGRLPAMYIYMLTSVGGRALTKESIVTISGGTMYSATYSRLNSQRTSETARSALATICPIH